MSTHRVNEFKLIDDEENEFTIFEYQEGIDKPSLKWIRTGASWFRLSDGTPVNKIDDDTFKVETTELIVISTVAEAADGCGRGMYYNGRRCVPQDDDGYGRRDYGPPIGGPTLRLDLSGGRDEGRYSPPNPRFRTWNNCPQNYTVQDGLCKPYRGR